MAAGMQRIIYVVPYTSIIEQTADVFREILGADQVLEHHSGVLYETGDHATAESISMAQATENWDIPVVVTTAVQFFESLYSNRPAACRKLHHLAKSVIVMDEAQMLPVDHLRPCVHALSELSAHYGASVVLCTATQPALTPIFREFQRSYPQRIVPGGTGGVAGFPQNYDHLCGKAVLGGADQAPIRPAPGIVHCQQPGGCAVRL